MVDQTKKLLRDMKKQNPTLNRRVTGNLILPNHSGEHDAGIKRRVPVNDMDLVNKKYVDDSVTGATGSWTAGSGETITVVDGLVTFITSATFFILLETDDFILLETGDKIING